MKRNYVYASKSVHGTCNVINYSGDSTVNSFLSKFDVWGSNGSTKFHNGDPYSWVDFWFECSKEFFEMLHTETMKRAFKHMGVELVFEYPFMEEFKK